MCTPESIVFQDKKISVMLGAGRNSDAHDLFEAYRIAGYNKDAFVAALIGRLCVLEAQKSLFCTRLARRGEKADFSTRTAATFFGGDTGEENGND